MLKDNGSLKKSVTFVIFRPDPPYFPESVFKNQGEFCFMSNNLILITCKKRYQFATITNYESWYERGFSKIKTFLALFHLYEASIK